jgi:sulfite exporter TauE/SafE
LAPSEFLREWIPWAVFGASLLGSAHCVGMCGGLILAAAPRPAQVARYHIGRLIGYLTLGTFAGSLSLGWIGTLVIAAGLIHMGVSVWRGRGVHFFWIPQAWLNRLYRAARGQAFFVGLLSVALPCGWLHGFVLAAASMHSPLKGALVLALFWLGTLPALTATPWIASKVLTPFSRRSPRMAAALLIAAGFLALGARAAPLLGEALSAQISSKMQSKIRCH